MRYHLLPRVPVGAGLMCAVAGLVATTQPVVAATRFAAVGSAQSVRDDTGRTSSVGVVDLAPEAVRADFAAGIVALHDFWYGEAEARFRAVQRAAPGFTLGYWGEALALHRNPFGFTEPPVDSMRAILARLASTRTARAALASSDHERRYLSALEVLIADAGTPAERHPAYAAAMAALARDHPEDVEALAFHARAILLTAPTFGLAPEVRARTAEAEWVWYVGCALEEESVTDEWLRPARIGENVALLVVSSDGMVSQFARELALVWPVPPKNVNPIPSAGAQLLARAEAAEQPQINGSVEPDDSQQLAQATAMLLQWVDAAHSVIDDVSIRLNDVTEVARNRGAQDDATRR